MLAIVPSVLLPILPHVLRLFLASMAKKEVMQPIIVSCPCCLKDFNLEASSEFHLPDSSSDTAAETASVHWKNTNTRPCPVCRSPIMKDGGCNHVKCGKCRADFCWACMRPRTSCRAYQCKNGAPFGNVVGHGSAAADGQGMTVIERIDNVEAVALRNLRQFGLFPFQNAAFICILCIVVSTTANLAVSSMHLIFVAVFYSLGCYFARALMRNGRVTNIGVTTHIADDGVRWQYPNNAHELQENILRRRTMSSFRWPGLRTEEDQLAEAIARSLVDQ